MVARIEPVRTIPNPSYNEEKVNKGRRNSSTQNNFLQEKTHYLRRKVRTFPAAERTEHPSAGENVARHAQFSALRKAVQRRTFRHRRPLYAGDSRWKTSPILYTVTNDARHPHIHIVTSIIRDNGNCIDTTGIGDRLSEPTRKAIEQEFQLLPSPPQNTLRCSVPDEIQKITPDNNLPISESMNRSSAASTNTIISPIFMNTTPSCAGIISLPKPAAPAARPTGTRHLLYRPRRSGQQDQPPSHGLRTTLPAHACPS